MPRIIHFDIEADNPERAMKFYSDIFGWTFELWGGGEMKYWLVMTGPADEPGIDGGLSERMRSGPADGRWGFLCTIGVPSADEYAAKVKAAGGTAGEKIGIPGVGWYYSCTDTEGNSFGIMQDDPKAGT